MKTYSRRQFFGDAVCTAAGAFGLGLTSSCTGPLMGRRRGSKMRFGLVTYLWAKDWDLPTLIKNCEIAKVTGVELRTQHAHGVEANLDQARRRQVKTRFENSSVTLVGLGTNFEFHDPDPAKLRSNIDGAKQYVILSRDVGSSGVKVKPNTLPPGVPVEKTIEQIGKSLNELGKFAADYAQEIRVEVHGRDTSQLPVMKRIFDIVDQPNVGVCWNCNEQDLQGQGLEYNFNLVRNRLGAAAHIRELDDQNYPYQQLFNLFVKADYKGWLLLEAQGRAIPQDRVKALAQQRLLFVKMVAQAQESL
jgi:sugar phosphate isomerase/epimerase